MADPLASGPPSPPAAVCLFKKKAKKSIPTSQSQVRKRAAVDEAVQHEPAQPAVVKASKRRNGRAGNPLCQTTGGAAKRLKAGEEASSEDEEEEEEDDERIASRGGVAYKAEGSARQQAAAMRAAQEAKPPLHSEAPPPPPPPTDDGLYRGAGASKHQLPKGSAKYGPVKGGPGNIRTITVVDYQPDVCKDYKETGYCGFGDTCKFLHDRGDYMHGWQLDGAFASRDKAAQADSEEEEEVPFACLICREPFKDPIVTKCGHYFCSGCAITRFAKTPKCFACGAPTSGIFNKATRIIERMKAKQERLRLEKEARRKDEEGLAGIEGLGDAEPEEGGSERSFYEDE